MSAAASPRFANPEGHLVQMDSLAWSHVIEQHDEMSGYLGETMATIQTPDHREPDPRAGRKRYVTVHLGPYEFERVAYDSEGDVLYLSRNEGDAATDTVATPEGHAVRLNEGGEVIGITVVNAKWLVERDGTIFVTVPSLMKANGSVEGVAITADDKDQLFSTHVHWNAS